MGLNPQKVLVCLACLITGGLLLFGSDIDSESALTGIGMIFGFLLFLGGIVLSLQIVVRLTEVPEPILLQKWKYRRSLGKAAYIRNYVLAAIAADVFLSLSLFTISSAEIPSSEMFHNYSIISIAAIVLASFLANYVWNVNEKRFRDHVDNKPDVDGGPPRV